MFNFYLVTISITFLHALDTSWSFDLGLLTLFDFLHILSKDPVSVPLLNILIYIYNFMIVSLSDLLLGSWFSMLTIWPFLATWLSVYEVLDYLWLTWTYFSICDPFLVLIWQSIKLVCGFDQYGLFSIRILYP